MPCFIDTMRPVTPAETEGWKLFLSLPRATWRDARMLFRRVHNGMEPFDALTHFVGSTGIDDQATTARLETVLQTLALERAKLY
jgi:hypothetical protein